MYFPTSANIGRICGKKRDFYHTIKKRPRRGNDLFHLSKNYQLFNFHNFTVGDLSPYNFKDANIVLSGVWRVIFYRITEIIDTEKEKDVINFERFELDNGLRILVHEDFSTPMAVLNVLYNVGARDERPDRTGFAHLFEHLMFSGSAHIDNFDDHIQLAGGENNAFTNNDITNFYDILPAQNIEVAFWLESDRMLELKVDEKELDIQRKVVLEEYKETQNPLKLLAMAFGPGLTLESGLFEIIPALLANSKLEANEIALTK